MLFWVFGCGDLSRRLPGAFLSNPLIQNSMSSTTDPSHGHPGRKPKYPGIPLTCNGNQLVAEHVEVRITEGGVFYPITPSTEGGEIYQAAYADGKLDVWGNQKIAIETEGEHAAQGEP